jgi:hypothetical protein
VPNSLMIQSITDLRWSAIRMVGNSPLVRASIAMPFVGYLILLNENLVTIRYLTPFNPWRLLLIYYGSFFLAMAAIIYLVRCPAQIQKYPSPVEYMNSELDFLTPFFRTIRLNDRVRDDLPLLKTEWVPLKIGPLLFIDRMVSNDAASYALVKAEAAAGGGRRPAFTRA